MRVVIDANVFVAAAIVSDVHRTTSLEFLYTVHTRVEAVYCPTLMVVEFSGTVTRVTNQTQSSLAQTQELLRYPQMNLVELTQARAMQASNLAAALRLRGADAVYCAVAQEFSCTLITWDQELLIRGSGVIPTMTPTQWLTT